MGDCIIVSISCTTYNQKDYIEEAIKSFLMQKTNFKYEILIHDDASRDGTTEIIKKYEEKYPDIIKPIYQIENQYSKGTKIGYEYNIKRAKGKYIALCEGDDYWTDRYKLQKQVDYMERNKDCTLCTHAVTMINSKTSRKNGIIRPYKDDRKIKTEDFIIGGGGYVGTNSLLFPKKIFENPPSWYFSAPVGDYPMQIFLASKGYAYYIDEEMSAYRVNAKGSWTNNMKHDYIRRWTKHYEKINAMLSEINIDTHEKYNKEIQSARKRNIFNIMMVKGDFKNLRCEEFKDIYCKLNKKTKFKIFLKQYFPRLRNILVLVRSKLINE